MKTPKVPNSPEAIAHVKQFLSEQPVGVLSTVTSKGRPHSAVIYFNVNDDLSVSFLTKNDTLKNHNIKRNNHVMLVSYEPESQTTLQIEGKAINITDTPEAEEVFRKTLQSVEKTSESGIPPISKLDAGRYVAYRIDPDQIRMAVFARPDPGGYEMYETLTF